MTYHFIVNPKAGKGDKQIRILSQIIRTCEKNKVEYDVHTSSYSGHATEISKSICKNSDDKRIYSCGGDGTLGEICTGVSGQKNVEIGCIPCGSGNDFVRNFEGVNFFDMEKQLNGDSQIIDMMKVSVGEKTMYSINAISIGFDSEVAMKMSRYKNIPLVSGSMSYIISILFSLSKLKGLNMTIEMEDGVVDGCFLLCMSGNGGFYGGGFNGAPLARLDDGLMDIVSVNDISIMKIPKLIALYKNGAHRQPDLPTFKNVLNTYKSSMLKITSSKLLPITVDGEGLYSKELSAEIVPDALKFVVPK